MTTPATQADRQLAAVIARINGFAWTGQMYVEGLLDDDEIMRAIVEYRAALTPSALSGDAGEGRVQKYLADEGAARARLATFPDAVRQRLINWQEGQSEWFSDTLLEVVAEFIAFDDAAQQGTGDAQ